MSNVMDIESKHQNLIGDVCRRKWWTIAEVLPTLDSLGCWEVLRTCDWQDVEYSPPYLLEFNGQRSRPRWFAHESRGVLDRIIINLHHPCRVDLRTAHHTFVPVMCQSVV